MVTSKTKGRSMRHLQTALSLAMCTVMSCMLPAQQSSLSTPVNARYFVDQVYPVLENAECRMCHNENGVSSATRLRFPSSEARSEAIQVFGLNLGKLIDRTAPDRSLLLNKPTLRTPHTGGERIAKGSKEESILRNWIGYLASQPEAELNASIARLNSAGAPIKRAGVLRRLTHSQYNNTVRDLLGDFTRPADQFPAEDFLHGFTNQVEGQSVPPLLAEAYTIAAEKLAANAFRRGDEHKLIPCKPVSNQDASCRDRFIREFGLKVFRRPLADKEVEGYAALFGSAAAAKGTFVAGAQVALEAMLQSPNFLFHLEEGPSGRWRQYGIASRLSYFLWDTLPNEDLLRAAGAGKLSGLGDIRVTAERMLDQPQAKRSLESFLAQWMRFDRVLAAVRNERQYLDFSTTLLPVMTAETRYLFNHLVWNRRNFMEIVNADYTFLSARLAQHYGMPAPPDEFAMVKYPPDSSRAGIFGHASILTLTGTPANTSPTSRGLFVREHLLCQSVPPPPPGVDTNLPAITAERPLTNKERLSVHLTNKSCASCHTLVDPIGLGFEKFDNIGRHREKLVVSLPQQRDAVTNERREPQVFELPLDTSAHIQGIPNSSFSTPKELGAILANDPTCQRCIVKQVFRYATGRHEVEADKPYLDAMFEAFRRSDFRFLDLVLAVVTSEPFLGEPVAASASLQEPVVAGARVVKFAKQR